MSSTPVDPALLVQMSAERGRATLALSDDAQLAIHRERPRWLSPGPSMVGLTFVLSYVVVQDQGSGPVLRRHIMAVLVFVVAAASFVAEIRWNWGERRRDIKGNERPARDGNASDQRITVAIAYGAAVGTASWMGWWWGGFPAAAVVAAVLLIRGRRWRMSYTRLPRWEISRAEAATALRAAPSTHSLDDPGALRLMATLAVTSSIHRSAFSDLLGMSEVDVADAIDRLRGDGMISSSTTDWIKPTRRGRNAFAARIHFAESAARQTGHEDGGAPTGLVPTAAA